MFAFTVAVERPQLRTLDGKDVPPSSDRRKQPSEEKKFIIQSYNNEETIFSKSMPILFACIFSSFSFLMMEVHLVVTQQFWICLKARRAK